MKFGLPKVGYLVSYFYIQDSSSKGNQVNYGKLLLCPNHTFNTADPKISKVNRPFIGTCLGLSDFESYPPKPQSPRIRAIGVDGWVEVPRANGLKTGQNPRLPVGASSKKWQFWVSEKIWSLLYWRAFIYTWLVVSTYTQLKNHGVKVSWDDDIPYYSQYMESHKNHVPNHQPEHISRLPSGKLT